MEIEYDFIKISEDEVSRAIVAEAKEEALSLMKSDLRNYIHKMGNESSFKGWISHICPENIKIDRRLEQPKSEWHTIWNTEIEKLNTQEKIDVAPVIYNSKKRKYK